MTPAIKLLQKQNIQYKVREYSTDDTATSYGMQAAEALNQNPEQVFKTLLATMDSNKKPVVAIIPVATQLDLKKLASHFSARKGVMADPAIAQRVTGYLLGGISPIGQKQQLKSCVDISAKNFSTIFVSGGKRGLQLEIKPQDLIDVINATTAILTK